VGVAAHLKHSAQPPTMGESFIMTLYKFYFSYSIEQNTFIVVSYFRNGRFINVEGTYSFSDYKNKLQAKYPDNFQDRSFLTHIGRIMNRFITSGTFSKGKSSGWALTSDEIVQNLKGRVEETPQISVLCSSQQSDVQSVLCMLLNKFKILWKNLQDLFLLKNTIIYVGRKDGVNTIFDSPV
jgi:hypothetical protein